jgi:hypothetical protein
MGLVLAGCGKQKMEAPLLVSGPLQQGIYIWQRVWNDDLRAGIAQAMGKAGGFTALAAEVSWEGGRRTVARPAIDHAFLKSLARPVGLAVRVGNLNGRFTDKAVETAAVCEMVRGVLEKARAAGLDISELQIDHDSAESQLGDYQFLIKRIRAVSGSNRLVVTSLPCWLNRPEFKALLADVDGFILQVHSLEKPASAEAAIVLCDPKLARAWVRQAGQLDVPFRVALPTYSYIAGFTPDGRLIAISAEGPSRNWGRDTVLKSARSNPSELAGLIREWQQERPARMTGVEWYRLPIPGDQQNWRWVTLDSVMAGRAPPQAARALARSVSIGLYDVVLRNDGAMDLSRVARVTVRWNGADCMAADAVGDFAISRPATNEARFVFMGYDTRAISPGDEQPVGWLRFDGNREVTCDVVRK